MKPILFFIICILCIPHLHAQDWVPKNTNTTDNIVDIYFKDQTIGFFLTNTGKIYKTIDSGENWDFFYQDSDMQLMTFDNESSIVCTNDSVFCYLYKFPQTTIILKSSILSPTFSKDTIAGMITDPQFWHNEIWSVQKVNEKIGLGGLEYYNIYGDYISASTATKVFYSNDFGETWTMHKFTTSPLSSQPYQSFYDGESYPVAIVHYPVRLYSTTDGNTWNSNNIGALSYFCFLNKNIVYTFSPYLNYLIYSNNTFSSIGSTYMFPYNILGVYFKETDLGFVLGKNGMLYKTTNGGGLLGVKPDAVPKNSIKVYPNPATNILHIDTPNDMIIEELSIINSKGHIVKKYKKHSTDIDLSFLSAGVYYLHIKSKQGVFCEKFVKK